MVDGLIGCSPCIGGDVEPDKAEDEVCLMDLLVSHLACRAGCGRQG
jgi:hypothetical protein